MKTDPPKYLKDLEAGILEMATTAEEALRDSLTALLQRDAELAAQVARNDKRINDMDEKIQADCLNLLALRQPMAADLRYVTSVMRISSDLERVGDMAKNIAKKAIALSARPPLPFRVDIESLGDIAATMLRDSITAFINRDTTTAREICRRDDQADALAREIIRDLLDHMVRDTPAVHRALDYIFIDRHLERVADYATNICESTILYAEGRNIKHHAVA